jgi:hypothetical protein
MPVRDACMRLECVSNSDGTRRQRAKLLAKVSASLLIAAALLTSPAAVAQDDAAATDPGPAVMRGEAADPGMPASNPRVKPLLAAHPGELLTICVAGCGKPQIVQALPKPKEVRSGAMRTTSGGAAAAAAPKPAYETVDRDSVLCVAGCGGKSDRVVQQMQGLPPVKVAPARADKATNEPLDIH